MTTGISADDGAKIEGVFRSLDLTASGTATPQVGAENVTNVKAFFCQNWPTARSVLQVAVRLPGVPGTIKAIIEMVIKAVDGIHGAICAGN